MGRFHKKLLIGLCCVLGTSLGIMILYLKTTASLAPLTPHICHNKRSTTDFPDKLYHDNVAQAALYQDYIDISRIAESVLLTKQREESMKKSALHTFDTLQSLKHKDISTVMMVWCESGGFLFKHVLSVLSVITFLDPDYIIFHYNIFPVSSKHNHWIQYLMMRYAYFKFEHSPDLCENGVFVPLETMQGDVYVSFDVILPKSLPPRTDNIESIMFTTGQEERLLVYRKGNSKGTNLSMFNCHNQHKIKDYNDYQTVHCYVIPNVKPSDIWQCNSSFCETARLIMYHQREVIRPIQYDQPVIPNVVHYIMFGKNYMDYAWYVSILSFIYIGNVSQVFIHCDNPPNGEYWIKLNNNPRQKDALVVVHRENPHVVFNQNLLTSIEHLADTVKLDILHHYGGILADVDLILIKPLDPQFYHYDFVIGRDLCERRYYCVELVNMGIIMSKPRSLFSQIYIDSLRAYRDEEWLWNAGVLPAKMLEYNPHLAHVSPELQILCLLLKCIKYDSMKEEETTLKLMLNNTYSLHFTDPAPFTSEEDLAAKADFLGDLGRYILSHAGITV